MDDEHPPQISVEDMELAESALGYIHAMTQIAVGVLTGLGDQQQMTDLRQPLGSNRDILREFVAKVKDLPAIKNAVKRRLDEKVYRLRADLQDMFGAVRDLAGHADHGEIVAALLADIRDELSDEYRLVLRLDAEERVRRLAADLLAGHTSPAEAAQAATAKLLNVAQSAANDGALDRIRKRSGDPSIGQRIDASKVQTHGDPIPEPTGALYALLKRTKSNG